MAYVTISFFLRIERSCGGDNETFFFLRSTVHQKSFRYDCTQENSWQKFYGVLSIDNKFKFISHKLCIENPLKEILYLSYVNRENNILLQSEYTMADEKRSNEQLSECVCMAQRKSG